MRVPNAENAVVDIRKLRDYCLNPTHEVGEHKARVFAAALDLGPGDEAFLLSALLLAVKTEDAVLDKVDNFGSRYIVDFYVRHGTLTARVRSVWIIDTGSEVPRLITCLVL